MNKTKKIWQRIIILIAAMVMTQNAYAQTAPAQIEDEIIEKAEKWFNAIETYQAKFTQLSSNGDYAEGIFSLKRPYRSRFDYTNKPLTIITTKIWLHIDEKDRKNVTGYPISQTPLRFIFSDPVKLTNPDIVTTAGTRDGVAFIKINQKQGLGAGKITLEFTEKPFALRRWIVTDGNKITTTILLTNPQKGIPLKPELFVPTNYANK